MKRLLFILLLLPCFGFGQITFQKTFGGVNQEYGLSVVQTLDTGYAITGGFTDSVGGNRSIYILKTDKYGTIQWKKNYRGTGEDDGHSIQQTYDGGYIVAGSTTSFGNGRNAFILKTDQNGDSLWFTSIGDPVDYAMARDIKQLPDTGYIIAGELGSAIYLIRLNNVGDTLWTNRYAINLGTDAGFSVEQTSDGGFIVIGHRDYTLLKIDSNGVQLWIRSWGNAGSNEAYYGVVTTDGGYAMIGDFSPDICLIKTNFIGDFLWAKTYGGLDLDMATSIKENNDGGFIITGHTQSFNVAVRDVYLIRTDSIGDTLWTKTYGGSDLDIPYDVQQTIDGGFIVTGFTKSMGFGNQDIYLIKTDACGNAGCYQRSTSTIVTTPAVISHAPGSGVVGGSEVYSSNPAIDTIPTINDTVLCFNCFPPSAMFSYSTALLSANFSNCSGSSWYWDFGDGNTDTVESPTHTYANSGTYNVCLMVTSECGTDSFCDSVYVCVIEPPVAGFDHSDSLLVVSFSDSSSNPTSWYWDFGDGNNGTVQNPVYTYANAGTYLVCLIATNDCGSDTLCDSITVTDVGFMSYYLNDEFTIHPNPTTGIFTVQGAEGEIKVHDLFGRLVLTSTEPHVDMSGFPAGLYFVKVGGTVRKLVKQ